jgi:ARG/rhodanese/phosphatase superfamily protein
VSQSLVSRGEACADQAWIWDDINAKSDRLAVDSGTSAMSTIFEAHQTWVDAYVNAFPPVEGQSGAVFLHEGIPVGVDLFDSEAVFVALLPKLVRSHALDALDPDDVNAPKHVGLADFRDEANSFLGKIAHAAQVGAKLYPTVGLGQAMRVEHGRMAAALLVEQHVVHLAAFNLGA